MKSASQSTDSSGRSRLEPEICRSHAPKAPGATSAASALAPGASSGTS